MSAGECAVQEISVLGQGSCPESKAKAVSSLPFPGSMVHSACPPGDATATYAMHATVNPLDVWLLDIIIKGGNGTSLASGGRGRLEVPSSQVNHHSETAHQPPLGQSQSAKPELDFSR